MRVIATAQGFDNIQLREVGEEFEMPEGATGSWFKPVKPAEVKPEPKGKGKGEQSADLA
jgi:hypothetical protein